MQVSTPDWPGSGNSSIARSKQGNTLGCIADDNIKVSQHFFGIKLEPLDTAAVLQGLQTASVVTDPHNPQLVRLNDSPADLKDLANSLGRISKTTTPARRTLAVGGVKLIAKPSKLYVPPWQLVSAEIQQPLRVASWWTYPSIASQHAGTPGCWDDQLAVPLAVDIATSGSWKQQPIGLRGGPGQDSNHAKLAVSQSGTLSVLGDMNQQGSYSPADRPCHSSQNGRGGLFFVVDDPQLHSDLTELLAGDTADFESANSTRTPIQQTARRRRRARRRAVDRRRRAVKPSN
eukprot:TRINITY_DN6973_c0_g1_i4.p1 TRINITY_DN6973_c0_g1~~TRINITY_DN6973_c0_g1_i4.p1  ORF type:complete len:289 (+),score=53.30 TRINITY_DN6973_c0_g1_i4:718-1584(+)